MQQTEHGEDNGNVVGEIEQPVHFAANSPGEDEARSEKKPPDLRHEHTPIFVMVPARRDPQPMCRVNKEHVGLQGAILRPLSPPTKHMERNADVCHSAQAAMPVQDLLPAESHGLKEWAMFGHG